MLVAPSTCGRCHADQVEQINASGQFRAYWQIIPKDSLHALTQVHEGRSHPEFGDAPNETGCMQCHGTKIELNEDGSPTPETWPKVGMGNIYPDGSTGICSACHTRHAFPNAEARRPRACASCHLRPDHPNIEIFETESMAMSTTPRARTGTGRVPATPGLQGSIIARQPVRTAI